MFPISSLTPHRPQDRRKSRVFGAAVPLTGNSTGPILVSPQRPAIAQLGLSGMSRLATRARSFVSDEPDDDDGYDFDEVRRPTTTPQDHPPNRDPDFPSVLSVILESNPFEDNKGKKRERPPHQGGNPGGEPPNPPGGAPGGPPDGDDDPPPPHAPLFGRDEPTPPVPFSEDKLTYILAHSVKEINDTLRMLTVNQQLLQQQQLVQQAPRPPPVTRSNLKDPDTFDGKDSRKLHAFLAQCWLHFAERPAAFPTDDDKILYSMSYLRGSASDWFQNELTNPSSHSSVPIWDGNYPAFVNELVTNFGPHDLVGDAEDRIQHLRMKDSDRISDYLVRFNGLAVLTGWDEKALRHVLYSGFPARLKDDLSRIEYDRTLVGIRNAASRADNHYWRREEEKKREGSSRSSAPSSGSSRAASSSSKSQDVRTASSSSASTAGSSAAGSASSSPKPYVDKLGKDGRLSSSERERRLQNDLCLYCGGAGHKSADCKKRAAASGRASHVHQHHHDDAPGTSESPPEEAKN